MLKCEAPNWTECLSASAFCVVPHTLFCHCTGCVPSRVLCVKYLCITLGCSSGARYLSLCFVSLVLFLVVHHCSWTEPLLCPLFPLTCFYVSLLHHGRAAPLCASLVIPKAIHFSGLFENRLLHFTQTQENTAQTDLPHSSVCAVGFPTGVMLLCKESRRYIFALMHFFCVCVNVVPFRSLS